jgi:UPF0755 protein
MKRLSNFALFLVIFSAIVITIGCTMYNINIAPVSKNEELKDIEIKSGNSYLTITSILKENNLIKSELFYKIYIKIFEPKPLEACTYKLSESMGVKGIVEELEKGCKTNPDTVKITVPEGKHLEQIADIVASKTNNSKEDIMTVWNSSEFIDAVIEKYDFITDEIKNKSIRYSLEGYFFPSTYELQNKDVTPEYVAYKMLDQLQKVLNKYQTEISNSELTVHEILTLSSIVEYEAILDSDRPIVAGVFYNRLNINMKLQSCATLGYAINKWLLDYGGYLDVDSPYNTYYYTGLPVGPGGMPSEKSIVAVLNPTNHKYYYFMANVCDPSSKKTYFSETYAQHDAYVRKYLTCQR